ncbi:hypothetical protein H8L83_25735, partial [Klebsiella quasipneumoniae]|nr:hypothetical protein [Klebsiella quasipneumoniae]
MGSYIANYQATRDGQVIYSGTLAIESEGTGVAVKEAVTAELISINSQFGGGVPD